LETGKSENPKGILNRALKRKETEVYSGLSRDSLTWLPAYFLARKNFAPLVVAAEYGLVAPDTSAYGPATESAAWRVPV
jgi:hypothetical protein